MKKFICFLIPFCFLRLCLTAYGEVITGQVNQDEMIRENQVIDMRTGEGIENAKITIPSKNYTVSTDSYGRFQLKTKIDSSTILSVEKEGYKPFTITINRDTLYEPLKIGIEKLSANDIVLDNTLYHLGDNVFSAGSANCNQFKAESIGPYVHKEFSLKQIDSDKRVFLVIGSVIGLDTKSAKDLRQNSIYHVYSSPALVFFNGQKIGELTVNGDSKKIPIPTSLIRGKNEVTIQTGRNLFQTAYVDYDDIEIMGLSIEIREKDVFGYFK